MRTVVALTKVCRRCGDAFVARCGKAIYCSERCGKRNRRAARRVPLAPRRCVICAAVFVPRAKSTAIHCSASCATAASRLRHPGRALANLQSWRRAHPERVQEHNSRRRARLRDAIGSHTGQQWLDLVQQWSNTCAYCGMSGPLEADHRIPLSRGGSNDIGNILPACRSCNAAKRTRTEDEYRAIRLARLATAA